MIHVEGFLFHGNSVREGVGGRIFARLAVECSTLVIANAGSNKCSARCARTAHDCRWRDNQTRALSREGDVFERGIDS